LNYIKELNAFYKLNEQDHLSPNEQALYNYLLHKCNTFGWAKYFTLTNTQIMAEVNIPDSTLRYARKNLIKKSYIKYKKGTLKQCGTYTMISLENKVVFDNYQHSVNAVVSSAANTVISAVTDPVVAALNKPNKTKQNYIYKEKNNKNNFNNFTPRKEVKENEEEDLFWLEELERQAAEDEEKEESQ